MTRISLHIVEVAAFRAYLAPQTIELQSRNLAVFAPNGRGKSSLADAIEFYLTQATTLPKFGEKATGNQAGYTALAHNAAEKSGIRPSVTLIFKSAGETFGSPRHPDGKMLRTGDGDRVAAHHRVDPVVRGHALRGFVESTTPDQRYTLVSDWLSLSALTEAQKAIRALRDQVGTDVKDESHKTDAERRLSRLTIALVKTWDVAALQAWLRSTYLDALGLREVDFDFEHNTPLLVTLQTLVREAENKVGLTALKQRLTAIERITAQADPEKKVFAGSLPAFEAASRAVDTAAEAERTERAAAAESAFHDVWAAAQLLLKSEVLAQDTCPVCSSAWDMTPRGSRSATYAHVVTSLASLARYEKARGEHTTAKSSLGTCRADLKRTLSECADVFRQVDQALATACDAAASRTGIWGADGTSSDAAALITLLEATASVLSGQIASAQREQNDQAPSKAVAAFDTLLEIYADLKVDKRQREQLSSIAAELDRQAAFVGSEIRVHITALLDELRTGTNDIYKAIQGDGAALVKLELPKESDKTQNRLNLVVDFAPNRTGVAPSGYLSDSQIHSVALALRLAAVRRFNPGMPLLVLDDISTSYDADYRRHLVAALKTWMGGCQLIVLTHDQRFFTYLREMLPPAEWSFKQINSLEPGYGPRMTAHLVKDEEVEHAWADGKSAANLMRQIEDETLLRWAQDFEVDIRIRKTSKPFDYGRAELAGAIARYFKEVGLKPPKVEGVFNPFLDSLRDGNVENFGSHFQDGPWGDGSAGDEKARWAEFKAFRLALRCPQCGGARFTRPFPQRYATCAKPKCEAQLRFVNGVSDVSY